jgi:DNA modification methylase
MIIRCAHDKVVPLSELKEHPKNPNKHSEDQVARLAEILNYQGWRYPIKVSNQSGFITSGHGRLLAAKLNGWIEVPVNFQDYEDEDQEYADVVSDNAIALWAELDLDSIKLDLQALSPEFNVDLLGIEGFETAIGEENEGQGEDETPEIPESPKVRPGDLFRLGEHRLLCGDTSDLDAVTRLMDGQKADMVFTDPPYNIASENSGFAKNSDNKQMAKLMDSEWDRNFDPLRALDAIVSVLSENATLYVCTSHHLAADIWTHMKSWASLTGWCVWSKPNPMPSLAKRHWTWNAELICYATRGKHVFNFPDEGHALSVWSFTKVSKCDLHPTMKPISIPEHAIKHSSNEGQIVGDFFGGAGSTMMACEGLGRKCFTMEISPAYCDVILDRWTKLTGKDPVREDGKLWSEVKNGES